MNATDYQTLTQSYLANPDQEAYFSLAFREIRHEITEHPIIYIGKGTCGIVAGADKTIETIRTYIAERQLNAEIIETGCIGLCSEEPLVDIQLPGKSRISFRKVTHDKVYTILDAVFSNYCPSELVLGQHNIAQNEPWPGVDNFFNIPFYKHQKRIVLEKCGLIDPENIDEYIANGGFTTFIKTIRNYTPAKVCDLIEQSGLRGRGGGGYNTGKKWKIALLEASDHKYLICNADESDPGAYMDRAIIEGDPFRLIEGIAIAAYGIGAGKAYVYVRSEYTLAIKRLQNALQKVKLYGITGDNIFDSGYNLNIIIRKGAGAFVCGEETALISSLEGKRGMPKLKPPYPAEKGFLGRPTVVNNVETLTNVPAILKNGPKWFNQMGSKLSKGTKVFALSGNTVFTGLIEVEMGTPLQTIVNSIGGGIKEHRAFKAVLIGGPSGTIVSRENIELSIDYESLQAADVIMGSGGIVVMDEDTCMVDITRFFISYLQKESCGKCIPCREGTGRMVEIIDKITSKADPLHPVSALERFKGVLQLESLAEVIMSTSLCGLGKTAPKPIISSLKWFREEYEEHIFERKCRAGVCTQLRNYLIDTEKCNGCNACFKKCPTNAIIGSPLKTHVIITEKCISCGICFDTCKFNAITF